MKVHCGYCSQQIDVTHSGYVKPHRVGKVRCIGSGANAKQMERHSEVNKDIAPGSKLAEKFKENS